MSALPKPFGHIRGWMHGRLYCFGGCGLVYGRFPVDVILPTRLWNRIAVGAPFDETDVSPVEGRGGVLCPACIIERLAALPECTAVLATIRRDDEARTLESLQREMKAGCR